MPLGLFGYFGLSTHMCVSRQSQAYLLCVCVVSSQGDACEKSEADDEKGSSNFEEEERVGELRDRGEPTNQIH